MSLVKIISSYIGFNKGKLKATKVEKTKCPLQEPT